MILKVALKKIFPTEIIGNTEMEISGVQSDSRKVDKGNIFVATRGTNVDGHNYISPAIEKGASAIVCETFPETIQQGIVYIRVENSLEALGLLACAWYGNPSEKLTLVGVTGTNGKTTIATLLYQMFRQLGYKAGLLSTVRNYVVDEPVEATHTTPDPLELNHLLAKMVE
ncbi:MAG TPA: Mur ligase domain-containing protein, partial [Paludibacteraceae bacterium]|nr:Mur ligase domain-containing protein [Paludibacteraceae bacterium]